MSTLRLIFPQWQGGAVDRAMPGLTPDDITLGYHYGAELLAYLAPNQSQKTVRVPISLDISSREVQDGVMDRDVVHHQCQLALDILRKESPERIVVLGGDCSVSVAPFTYLAQKYENDVAMIWIDAHPDINLPYDGYSGFHTMATTAIMGYGDEKLVKDLPAQLPASKILMVGVHVWAQPAIKQRQREYAIKNLSPYEVSKNSDKIRTWLSSCGASKVVIHVDWDVIEPADLLAGMGVAPGGISVNEVIRIINDIAAEKDIVGLTFAELMPRTSIRVRNILRQLPLINE